MATRCSPCCLQLSETYPISEAVSHASLRNPSQLCKSIPVHSLQSNEILCSASTSNFHPRNTACRDGGSGGAGGAYAPPDFGRIEVADGQQRPAALLLAHPYFQSVRHPASTQYCLGSELVLNINQCSALKEIYDLLSEMVLQSCAKKYR